MKAVELYYQLSKDFIIDGLSDTWAVFMGDIEEYLTESFKKTSMGLVCDFTEDINRAYTAVFPTEAVMQKILTENITDALLFLHHPSIWDIRGKKSFYQMNKELLKEFKKRRIAIYILHVPLDNYGEYSTSKTLAAALNIVVEKPFKSYCGALSGVIGITKCKTIEELNKDFSHAMGHNTKLYSYGDESIIDGRVAIVAGGGNSKDTVKEILEEGINVFITGVSANSAKFKDVHELEKLNHINVLGGTHYSTEKFACKKMCTYFENLGLKSAFIEGEPIYEDM